MKNNKYINLQFILLLVLIMTVFIGCERDFSDDVEFAKFPTDGSVFIDTFSPGLDFFPFVDEGADPNSFSVIMGDDVFSGTSAIRFDVPTFGNGFVGATFNTTVKRDLSDFDALTFFGRASQAATIDAVGFGIDASTNDKFLVTLNDLEITTKWEKFVIPIPDPSMLIGESGLFWLAEGAAFEGDEGGYALFFDEIKFEKVGTLVDPSPAIFSGQDLEEEDFTGAIIPVSGLTQTFTIDTTGVTKTVTAAPAYFDFVSSDIEVARVSELGEISTVTEGTATITASIAGVSAVGSLEVTSTGILPLAPIPTLPPANVKSIFSETFVNETESDFSPGFGGSTTETTVITNNGNIVVTYTDNNFTGIIFENTVDASELGFLHVDVFVQEPGIQFEIQIRDVGANLIIETDPGTGLPIGDDVDFRFDVTGLTVGQWTSFDIPLAGDLVTQSNNLGALILVAGPDFILDNIYFFKE